MVPTSPSHLVTPSPPRFPARLLLALAAHLLCLPLCAAALGVASLFNLNDATLTGVSQPDVTPFDCLVAGHLVRPGSALKVNTEWVIDDDLVPVLSNFRRQGWYSTTQMTTNIQLLPVDTTAFNLGLLRVQVFRALALSYTQAGTTHVVATTRVVACPP